MQTPTPSSPATAGGLFHVDDSLPTPSLFNPFNPVHLYNVDGLVAVITGAATGIGLMMATALENNGATVYILGRRLELLEKAVHEKSRHGNIIPIQCDVTKREDLLAAVEVVRARHGYINLLVNNAGIARNLYRHPLPGPTHHPTGTDTIFPSPPASPSSGPSLPSISAFQSALWDTGSPDDFAETFATNVTAVYYTTVAFLGLLHQGNVRQQRHQLPTDPPSRLRPPYHTSQVLSVSSSGSFRLDAKILSPSYTLSKIACTHLGKLLANLLSPWGIRSNVLAPGVWPSEMTTCPAPGIKLDPSTLADYVPLRRTGSEEDMAGTILFLASRAGAYVNGAVWLVDGGRIGCVPSSY